MTTIRLAILMLGVPLFAAAAFAQSMPHGMAATDAPASPAAMAMMDGMTKMQQDMATTPMTGDADRDFVAMMIPHHVGAVDMAKIELQYGKDPAILKLARAVVAAQTREIGEMKAWQAKHPGR